MRNTIAAIASFLVGIACVWFACWFNAQDVATWVHQAGIATTVVVGVVCAITLLTSILNIATGGDDYYS